MRSKTSWFDKTLYRKHLTRWAPLWGLYTLCLLGGMTMLYVSNGQQFWFASRLSSILQKYVPLVNLVYGALAALMIFGDLYDTRMCYSIHALPLRREAMFLSGIAAGLTFSVLPGLLFTLCSIPLAMGTCVEGAWVIAPLWLLANTFQFMLFFGIAVLCVFLTGNRYTMLLAYIGINFFSMAVFYIVDRLYTPMLYGVVTPETIKTTLMPLYHVARPTVEVESYFDVMQKYWQNPQDMTAGFTIYWNNIGYLALCGLAGLGFMAAALVLYRKRKLEFAGDALAVKCLEPLVPILCGLAAGILGYLVVNRATWRYSVQNPVLLYSILAVAIGVGWFAGKMLLAKSAAVFKPKAFLGWGLLTAVMALSLVMTKYDVFKIDDYVPDASQVEKAEFYCGIRQELTDPQDIETVLKIQQGILRDRETQTGLYFLEHDWENVNIFGYYSLPADPNVPLEAGGESREPTLEEMRQALDSHEAYAYETNANVYIDYHMKDGRLIQRRYVMRSNSEAGNLTRQLESNWDALLKQNVWLGYAADSQNEAMDFSKVTRIFLSGIDIPREYLTQEHIDALLAALKADCEAGNLSQTELLHRGFFSYGETVFVQSLRLSIDTSTSSLSVTIGVDSTNTIDWFRERGLNDFLVTQENLCPIEPVEPATSDFTASGDMPAVG